MSQVREEVKVSRRCPSHHFYQQSYLQQTKAMINDGSLCHPIASWVSYFVFVLIQKLHGERNTGYIWLNRKVFLMWKRAFEGVFRRRSATKRTGVIKSRKSNKFLHRLQMHWHTVDLTSYGMDKVQGKFSLWTRKPEHLRIYGIV